MVATVIGVGGDWFCVVVLGRRERSGCGGDWRLWKVGAVGADPDRRRLVSGGGGDDCRVWKVGAVGAVPDRRVLLRRRFFITVVFSTG